jgi:hypothetical protein
MPQLKSRLKLAIDKVRTGSCLCLRCEAFS